MIEKWIKCRYILTILLTLGMMNAFIMRVNISVAIVAMVDAPEIDRTDVHECRYLVAEDETSDSVGLQNITRIEKPFKWDAKTRGWILSAFYYGYITTPLLGGWLEHRFGGKIVFGSAVFLSSLVTLLMPTMSFVGPWALVASRVILGIVQGPVYPSHHGMWGKWAPPVERSKLMSIAMTGPYVGVAIAYLVSGALADSRFFKGWPSIFYATGTFGVAWSVLWAILAFDSPETHPRIREDEREYLRDAIGKRECKIKTPPVPWKDIVRSPQVWSLFFAHFSLDWGFRNLSINLPSFMDQVLGVDISKNSILSAIPFLAVCIFIALSDKIYDFIRRRKLMTPLNFKRTLVFFAQIVPAVFLVAVGHIGCDHVTPVLILTMAAGFGGLSTPGILVNFAEIAPRFAGVLFGMSNTISIMSGQLAPVLVGYVTGSISDLRYAWQIVFYVGAAVSALGGIVFMITVRVDVLPWAKLTKRDSELDSEDENLRLREPNSEMKWRESKHSNLNDTTTL
ncbi:putative transporter slc-17.2 [Styela clava]